MDSNSFVPQMGMDVIGSDGEKVGEIDSVEQDYFVVRKGFFFPQDHYIPFSAVDSYEDGAVYLNVTKDGALEQQWTDAPAMGSDSTVVGSTQGGYVDTDVNAGYGSTNVTDTTYGETRVDDAGYASAGVTDTTYAESNLNDRSYSDRDLDDHTIEVREEDLHARTREVDRGAVHVEKNVIEERESIDVPLREEEVHIERRSVDRPADGIDFQDASFEVPLRGEEVEISKTARVVEEIDIDKTATERVERVSDTVRREEVEITGDGIDVDHNHTAGHYSDSDDRGLLDRAKDALTDDDKNRGSY